MALFSSSIILFTLSLFFFCDNVHSFLDPFAKEDPHREHIKYSVVVMENEYILGSGTVIGKRFILTAAHMVINNDHNFKDGIKVFAGTNIVDVSDYGNRIYRDVAEIVVPTYYVDLVRGYDIAVLILSTGFDFNSKLEMLHIPPANYNIDHVRAVVSGIGVIGFDYTIPKGIVPKNLRYQYVDVLPKTECQRFWGSAFQDSQICGTIDGSDAGAAVCSGDSGSGLAYDGKVIGVVSYGNECQEGPGGKPSLYTDVTFFSGFIKGVMNGHRDPTFMRARRYSVAGKR